MNNKQKTINEIIFLFCLIVLALLTSFYLLMLGWYNTISLDDYGFIASIEQKGVWAWMIDVYNTWQGRFSGFLVSGLTMIVFGRAKNLIFYTFLLLFSGWWSCERLFTGINQRYGLNVPHKIIVCLSVITVNVGVMSFFEPSTFYWICAHGYTLSIWATILLVYSIFYSNNNIILRWSLVLICSFYICGIAENYTPIVIGGLCLIWIYSWIGNQKLLRNHSENTMLLISILILTIGCVIMILAPGNRVRLEACGLDTEIAAFRMSIGDLLLKIMACSTVILMRIFSISYYFVLMFLLFIGIGSSSNSSMRNNIGKNISVALIIFLIFIVSSVAICVFGVGGNPPVRALSFISFGVMALCAYSGIRIGAISENREKKRLISLISIFLLIIISVTKSFHDIPIAKDYHDYIIQRNNSITKRAKETNEKSPYICKPYDHEWENNNYSKFKNIVYELMGKEHSFYEPYMIFMESDLSSDPNDFRNIGLKKYLNVDFDIICNESPSKEHID